MLKPYSSTQLPGTESWRRVILALEGGRSQDNRQKLYQGVFLYVFLFSFLLLLLFFLSSQPHPTFLQKIEAENTYYLFAFSVLVPEEHLTCLWPDTDYIQSSTPPFISHIEVLNILLCKASCETHGPKEFMIELMTQGSSVYTIYCTGGQGESVLWVCTTGKSFCSGHLGFAIEGFSSFGILLNFIIQPRFCIYS